ncbi:MAG TPA: protease HtpX, partial [Paenibacillaceae bacterium]|nr:protease HtpX [Paenibacillaceae bacterium]
MFKRISLFLLTNILVIVTIGIVASVLGVNRYIDESGINFGSLLAFSAIIGFTGSIISLLISKQMAKWVMGVQVIDPNNPHLESYEQWLVQEVHDLAREAGISKMPQVGIYNSPEVNAFATGPSKNNSLVAVSTGLLERMDKDAVSGVLSHEIAHVANGDMVTMTLLQGVINTFVVFLSRVIAYIASTFVREEVAGIVHFVVMIILDILLSILGSLVVMAFSRYREYRADEAGARLGGRDKMIYALESLRQAVDMDLVDDSQKAATDFWLSSTK